MKLRTIRRNLQSQIESYWMRVRSRFVDVEKLTDLVATDVSFGVVVLQGSSLEETDRTVESITHQLYRNHTIRMSGEDESTWIDSLDSATAEFDFIAIVDPGAVLEPDALLWAAVSIQNARDLVDWLYFDHVEPKWRIGLGIINRDGTQRVATTLEHTGANWESFEPVYKPGYSPEHLLSGMFAGGFNVFRSSRLATLLDVRAKIKYAIDPKCLQFEVALRLNESDMRPRVQHVPQIVYTASPNESLKQIESQRLAIERHLDRRAIRSSVEVIVTQPLVCSPELKVRQPASVTVVIPTRNQFERVRKCVADVRATTDNSVQIRMIDNQSDDPVLFDFYRAQEQLGRFTVESFDEPFNYARMHNQAIEKLDSEFVLLLNNDVFEFCEGWVEQLVATAQLSDDIGCVGGLLRYPDGMTQHGGVSFGIGKPCRHIHLGIASDAPGYRGRLQAIQQLSALTAALLLVRRAVYTELGGFDEQLFPISYNDTDLCLKMRCAGFRSIYNPRVTAIHEESVSRGQSPLEKKWRHNFMQKWSDEVKSDEFYNPHLSRREYEVDSAAFRVWQARKQVSLEFAVRAA